MCVCVGVFGRYYRHDTPASVREWPARGTLMRQLLGEMDADVVCIQEGRAPSFEEEFGFMDALGYSHVRYSRPFRMPMLTFWKRGRLRLLGEKSANRTLVTVFELLPTGSDDGAAAAAAAASPRHRVCVVNCHLSAGEHGDAPRKR
jgi:hypothetical protein